MKSEHRDIQTPCSTAKAIPVVPLSDLPFLTERLIEQVRAHSFTPELVVYVERGARLLASEMCRMLECGAIAVSARRGGGLPKQLLAPLARLVPRQLRDHLRKLEERWFWQRRGGKPRQITSDFTGTLAGQRVLVVDDAADSGRTIAGCRAWLVERGVDRADIRVAVLAATTEAGRTAADFWVLEQNSRLPWSSDSTERRAALAAMKNCHLPPYAPRDF